MDYLAIAFVLIAIGVFLLVAEIFIPTGGFLVVAALGCFAFAVGIILYYGTMIEGVVAMIALAIGLPAIGYAAVAAWRRMSLDTVLEEQPTVPAVPTSELEALKGRTGKTVSPMRPSGVVEFDGRRYDALTEGMMLEAGVWVRCIDVKWGQIIVRQLEGPPDISDVTPEGPATPVATQPPTQQGLAKETAKPDNLDDFDLGLR